MNENIKEGGDLPLLGMTLVLWPSLVSFILSPAAMGERIPNTSAFYGLAFTWSSVSVVALRRKQLAELEGVRPV